MARQKTTSQRLPPAVALATCIARALHELDPRFHAALRSTVADFRWHDPSGPTAENLEIFAAALDDPEIFVRHPSEPPRRGRVTE
jgi:hypothetical protein